MGSWAWRNNCRSLNQGTLLIQGAFYVLFGAKIGLSPFNALETSPSRSFLQQENQADERGQENQNQHAVNQAQLDFRGPEQRMMILGERPWSIGSLAFVPQRENCVCHAGVRA